MYQESYDNAGLITGNSQSKITGVLLCLDSTEAVLDEAIKKKCNLVIAHHPIVFRGLKRFTGRNYVERVIIKAIKNDIAIYAAHTNLDNVHNGVNAKICEKLGLKDTRILSPKPTLKKLQTYAPVQVVEAIRASIFNVDGGTYSQFENMSFTTLGVGTINGQSGAQSKIELVFDEANERQILQALHDAYPSEDVPYDILKVENKQANIGSGMIGTLPRAETEAAFLKKLKNTMKAGCVRHTALLKKSVKTVAVCGGSGGFLLPQAIRQGADIFVTADYKYHDFFDADGRIVIADIGHYESEQFTIELFNEFLTQKFNTFAVYLTKVNTNPVNYL